MWSRCGIDTWHLDCLIGATIDINNCIVKSRDHDYIAAIVRKDNRFILYIPPSFEKVFESIEALNYYLKKLGLEEIELTY